MMQPVAGLAARQQAIQPMSVLSNIDVHAALLPWVTYLFVCKHQPLLADSISC